jgi:hypothetical protein
VNRPTPGRRAGVALAVAIVALGPTSCARERRQITPTTLGSNLRAAPRGRMITPPWPGNDLVRAKGHPAPGGPPADPEAATASAEAPSPILRADRP